MRSQEETLHSMARDFMHRHHHNRGTQIILSSIFLFAWIIALESVR